MGVQSADDCHEPEFEYMSSLCLHISCRVLVWHFRVPQSYSEILDIVVSKEKNCKPPLCTHHRPRLSPCLSSPFFRCTDPPVQHHMVLLRLGLSVSYSVRLLPVQNQNQK